MRALRRVVLGVAVLALGAVACAHADDLQVAASVSPVFVRVGQMTTYTGRVLLPHGRPAAIRFSPPDSSDALTWGRLRATRRVSPGSGPDTIVVQAQLQAFRLGGQSIPGLAFVDAAGAPGVEQRLPVAKLTVVPVIAANDSSADLRPVRGPLKAPWWEVVPWAWVIAIAGIAGLSTWLILRMLSRLRRPALTVVPAARRDPSQAALERLAALRERHLPEAGQFGLHALELTAILRRFLEATTTRLRPGFTTSELTGELKDESVPAPDALLLVSLMRVWDRVKFARAPFTLDESRKSEEAVEAFVRRRAAPKAEEAA